jgi:tRNA G18 (ribose-2'-O)-methylase SpoU
LRVAGADCPVYVARQTVFDGIAGFPIHRGVLASVRRPEARDPLGLAEALLAAPRPPRILVLEGLTNHDNVGGIFRNAMGLGGDAVLLCPRTCDPLYRKAIRTSMGAALCVPFARAPDFEALLEGLASLGYRRLGLDPDPSGVDLAVLDPAALGPSAILLGTEGAGLSEKALARVDLRARIDMEPGVDSLNVAVASAIALHRLRVEPSTGRQATRVAKEGISDHGV